MYMRKHMVVNLLLAATDLSRQFKCGQWLTFDKAIIQQLIDKL